MKTKGKGVVVVGTQWGDEGKGKIVDWLTEKAHAVARFHGGHNAGHTLVIGEQTVALQIIPSGIMHPAVACYIGNGVVLSIDNLLTEIAKLEKIGIDVRSRLKISDACALVLPLHSALDFAREGRREKNALPKIGTTGKGIGPAYEDKIARRAIRVQDLYEPAVLQAKLTDMLDVHNFMLQNYYQAAALDYAEVLDNLVAGAEQIKSLVTDTSKELNELYRNGKNILFEGAQGTFLDIDHGTYPYVTSSNCVAGNAAAGSGVGPGVLNYVLGIAKAYCTRVGSGPFPTELDWDKPGTVGAHLSSVGAEKGVVTGRSRRCGWFDAALLKRSVQVNGVSGLAITKLDVLDGLTELKICIGYKLADGSTTDLLPNGAEQIRQCEPIYEVMPGWQGKTVGINKFEQLPLNAQKYLRRIEQLVEAPVHVVSTSPDRNDTITVVEPFN